MGSWGLCDHGADSRHSHAVQSPLLNVFFVYFLFVKFSLFLFYFPIVSYYQPLYRVIIQLSGTIGILVFISFLLSSRQKYRMLQRLFYTPFAVYFGTRLLLLV